MMKYAVKLNCVEIVPWINMKENNTKKHGKIIGALPLQPRSTIWSNASAQCVYLKSASAQCVYPKHLPSASALSIRPQHPPGGLRGCPPPPHQSSLSANHPRLHFSCRSFSCRILYKRRRVLANFLPFFRM